MEASYFVSVPAVQLEFPGMTDQHSTLFTWLCTTAQSIKVDTYLDRQAEKRCMTTQRVAVHKILSLQLGHLNTANV